MIPPSHTAPTSIVVEGGLVTFHETGGDIIEGSSIEMTNVNPSVNKSQSAFRSQANNAKTVPEGSQRGLRVQFGRPDWFDLFDEIEAMQLRSHVEYARYVQHPSIQGLNLPQEAINEISHIKSHKQTAATFVCGPVDLISEVTIHAQRKEWPVHKDTFNF